MRRLSRREIKKLSERLGFEIEEKKVYEERVGDIRLYLFGDEKKPKLVEYKNELFPTFYFKEAIERLPKVIVDRGAAEALKRGADLMAPGVRSWPSVDEGSLVVVMDEQGNPVGIGKALVKELPERGKVVKMLHVLSPKDRVTKAILELR